MRINPNQFVVNKFASNSNEEIIYFTNKGSESYLDDNENPRLDTDGPKVYAKAIKNKRSKHFSTEQPIGYSFYIKTDPNKKIYNPTVLQSIEPKIQKSFINKVCKNDLIFTEVTQSIFNQYINFLRTGNNMWLNRAQREIK